MVRFEVRKLNKNNVLYEIKELDKLAFRKFVNLDYKNLKKLPTPTQIQIINCIKDSKEGFVYQRDLEKMLKLRRATISGVLKTMEKNDMISRVISDGDIRAKKVVLNDKAKNIFKCGEKKLEKLDMVSKKGIDEKDLNIFFKVIKKMRENIEDYKEDDSKC